MVARVVEGSAWERREIHEARGAQGLRAKCEKRHNNGNGVQLGTGERLRGKSGIRGQVGGGEVQRHA